MAPLKSEDTLDLNSRLSTKNDKVGLVRKREREREREREHDE